VGQGPRLAVPEPHAAAVGEALGEPAERERNSLSRRFNGIDIEEGGGRVNA